MFRCLNESSKPFSTDHSSPLHRYQSVPYNLCIPSPGWTCESEKMNPWDLRYTRTYRTCESQPRSCRFLMWCGANAMHFLHTEKQMYSWAWFSLKHFVVCPRSLWRQYWQEDMIIINFLSLCSCKNPASTNHLWFWLTCTAAAFTWLYALMFVPPVLNCTTSHSFSLWSQ